MWRNKQLKARTDVTVGGGKRSPLDGIMGRGNRVWIVGMRTKKWRWRTGKLLGGEVESR